MAFVDDQGSVTHFAIRGLDTTAVNTTDCGGTYNYQYIINTLYLNGAKTDSIYFNLFNRENLEGRAISSNEVAFAMWDVLGKAKEGKQAKSFPRYTINNRTFNDVILVFRNDYALSTIDSVVLSNHVGIVSFKYNSKRYTRQ